MPVLLGVLLLIQCSCSIGQMRSPEITENPADLLVPRNEPATLNCKAEGKPIPRITWFKNGREFRIKEKRHVLLETGDLFFLQVLQTKDKNDSGLYWCQASNDVGSVRSKNATLEIAVLSEEFGEEPQPARVAEGETALLNCTPPKGHPDPVVVWTKDGKELELNTRHRFKLIRKGSLVISGVRLSDSGDYVCRARNVYGTKESSPARLSVLIPPHLVSTSSNITGTSESTIEIMCRVGGQPPPEVYWQKVSGGELPIERMSHEENGQVLKIRHVSAEDQGTYSCRAENPVGTVSANISLTVHSRPVLSVSPMEGRVAVNGTVSFECRVSGNPAPTTYWTHEGTGLVVGTEEGAGVGRFFVDASNTLTLRRVTKKDQGYYVCVAVGIAGSAFARAHLEVQSVSDMPPPLIALGAPNQTLPLGTEGEMPCEARGTPEPKISWFVGKTPFRETTRATINPFGTLRIIKLKASDSGVYTCKATSVSGTTEWTTSMVVANPTNPNVAFFKMQSDTALPEPPPNPKILSVNVSSVTLGWRRGRSGASTVLGYSVQMWSPDLQEPWQRAITQPNSHPSMPLGAIVTNLLPDKRYLFVVRASNSHGLSRPSETTPLVRTLSSSHENKVNLMEVRTRLNVPSLRINTLKPVSSSSIEVSWQLLIDDSLLEGIHVRYRPTKASVGALSLESVNLHSREKSKPPSSHVITGLLPSTEYEVFVTPFFSSVEGQPSAAMRCKTLESVPNVPPRDLKYVSVNSSSVQLSWDPISPLLANGKIIGYLLQVFDISGGSNELLMNTTVESASIVVGSLVPGSKYRASVLGLTAQGPGPESLPLPFSLPEFPATEETIMSGREFPALDVERNYYLIAGIAAASIIIFVFLFGAVFFIYRHRRKNKSNPYFTKSESKDPWCDYPECWNDTCKSIGGGTTASTTHHSLHSYTNHKYQKPISPESRARYHNDCNGIYKIKPLEDVYEDPDGLRLVSFNRYGNKRSLSPEPYATTPLIPDNHYKGTIKSGKDFIPNIAMSDPSERAGPDVLSNRIPCDRDGGPLFPVFQFPPPPPISTPDPSVTFGRRNEAGVTRFLQQQLPYSFVGSTFGGSSSGASQNSHESPLIGNRCPHRTRENRQIPQPEISLVIDPRMDPFHESLFSYPSSNIENFVPRSVSAIHGFPAPPKSFEGEGYSQPMNQEMPEPDVNSSSGSSCCSGRPHHINFVESVRANEVPRRERSDCRDEERCDQHSLEKQPVSGSRKSSRAASYKKPKPPKGAESLSPESVTSPLI